MSTTTAPQQRSHAGLGTFAGVFTPSILTILGLILFRRLGYVVGGAGLVRMLVILGIAHAISVLTSTSLSAIATNMRVKGGGDYYLISRSLGVAFGGALGIVLFLAQSISVAFYCIGLGEAVAILLPPDATLSATGVATTATLFLFFFAWAGSDWATKLQYVVMGALVLALGSFFVGGIQGFSGDILSQNWSQGAPDAPGFWVLFALFFPAVTGFTQGVSMSGDLKDPGRSLPTGTFWAVAVSLVVYGLAAVVVAGNKSSTELVADYEAMNTIAVLPVFITAGIVAATLSSALASFLGAPRILQALASDRIFPMLTPFAKGYGASNNPRLGVLLTLVIALGVVALGGVDVIAPIVSMFFLISYGLLNYATALEARANSPSFRPKFRFFHRHASMIGALACLGVMLAINPISSAISLAFLWALHHFVRRVAGTKRWSDSRRDVYFSAIRKNLLAMAKEPMHPRNWRPHLLVFSDKPRRRAPTVHFAAALEGGAGMTTVVRVLEGTGEQALEQCRLVRRELAEDLEANDLHAFPLVVAAPYREIAAQTVIQAHGLGPIGVNTILLNWSDQVDGEDAIASDRLVRRTQSAARLGVNVVLFDGSDADWDVVNGVQRWNRRIDVWWSPDKSGRLMLLLAYMVTRSEAWQGATIRLVVVANRRASQALIRELRRTLEEVRIEAQVHAVAELSPDVVVKESADAAMVFAPLRFRGQAPVDLLGRPVAPILDALPLVALVSAVDDVDLDADPEAGTPGQMAALGDAARDLEKRKKRLELEIVPARKAAQDARRVATKTLEAYDAYKKKRGPKVRRTMREDALEKKSREAFQRAAQFERTLRNLEEEHAGLVTEIERAESELQQLQGIARGGRGRRPPAQPV